MIHGGTFATKLETTTTAKLYLKFLELQPDQGHKSHNVNIPP